MRILATSVTSAAGSTITFGTIRRSRSIQARITKTAVAKTSTARPAIPSPRIPAAAERTTSATGKVTAGSLVSVTTRGGYRCVRSFLRQSAGDRALPEVPPADVRGGRGPGGGDPDADQRDRRRQGAPGLPLRRAARHREDIARPDPREGAQLPERPDRHAVQRLPLVRRDLQRHLARRDRDGRRVTARDRRHPRDPRARRPAAGRGRVEGLHPRRGAPADGRRMERAPEAHRGAPSPPRLRLLHDRAAEGAADGSLALPDLRVPAAAAPGHRAL